MAIAEDEKEYLIKAEIPEVDKKDVRVIVQEGVLTIQGWTSVLST